MRLIAAITVLICLSACSPPQQTVTIEFEARLGDQPIDCETTVNGVSMTDLRFYVHSPVLFRWEKWPEQVPEEVELTENGRWQSQDMILIDLENGAGACENGTLETNAVIVGTVPEGDYQGLSLTIGVPFSANHADPLAAPPPLDDSTMHWHWRSGYKFLRAGIETPDDGFWIHVGSAGCEGTVDDISGCRYPNRMMLFLRDYRLGEKVVFDLNELTYVADLSDSTPTDCSSGPSESSCEQAFTRLGLDFANGETQGNGSPWRAGVQ